jgi:NAD(P)-dependent dehydrogenase (short-subunit alcohol dehydrogenase family)
MPPDSPDLQQASTRMRTHVPAADELAGRVIAITGANGGIGRAVALAAARHGAQVLLVGRTVRKLETVYDEILAAGGRAQIAPLNFESAGAAEYQQLADAVAAAYGRLDGLLHNAALLGTLTPLEHYDVPQFCKVLHVNLTAAFVLTQSLMPMLRASTDASLVFTSSSVGRRGRAYWGAYAVSKFGVEGLAQTLAEETAHLGSLRVNVINPGATRTPMRRAAFPAEDLNASADPAELANAYLWLLGPAGRGVHGLSLDAQAPRG